MRKYMENSMCVDLFGPKFFPFLVHQWGGIGTANRFRIGLTHAAAHSAKFWRKTPSCRTMPLWLCERYPKAVLCPDTPSLVSQKRQKLQSKKVNPDRVFRVFPHGFPMENSRCVDFFRPNSFPHMVHLGCHIGRKDPIRIGLGHNEISSGQSQSHVEKTRYGLTFFDRFLFHIWCTNGVVSETQTAFGTDSHISSFPCWITWAKLGKLDMCWFFLIEFFSIYGAPTVPYRGKRIHSDWTYS
jgi:hypothetical protein